MLRKPSQSCFPEFLCEVFSMPEPVRCDVCGKLFSSRHLSSHKRLAHAKEKLAGAPRPGGVKTVFQLFKTLFAEDKTPLLSELSPRHQETSLTKTNHQSPRLFLPPDDIP